MADIEYIIDKTETTVRYNISELPNCRYKGDVTKYKLEHMLLDCEDVKQGKECSHSTEKTKKWKQTRLAFH